ncbi:hypothetical protein [Janthinobacterium agaricidamnosum]|uniref:DUF885 domain-containing protein n=1 Tax=Janthinobacterium agaricidamnosum NBRC 102515 = DSM 9628 TaxID=1349767 RepID=W0V8E6_9BURK|nr:hypothetical protein [Janthinobacterium agaricidamnosum]CDG83618.1 putative uncharacterized protein [Janthinobacterium agaricidamnosum NBRC 102515 = DSM 9628]
MPHTNSSSPVQAVAEHYVKLVLALGQHDAMYVDAYYGPAQLQQDAIEQQLDLVSIRRQAGAALQQLSRHRPADTEEQWRMLVLDKQLHAMQARVDMLNGQVFPFDQETTLLYDAVSPHHERAYYEQLVGEIDQLLAGPGPLTERLQAFRRHFVIPPDKLQAVMDAAIRAGRERTLHYIDLPPEENFVLEFVTDKPWSGYNWYKGNYQSVIQINTDLPIYIERAVDLGCHEGYPGHHVFNVLLEQALVRNKNWVEYSVYPLFSPQSLIAEGTANYGIELTFNDAERLVFEQEVLYPLAGLDGRLAEKYARLNQLLAKLSYADNDAAMLYLNGTLTPQETIDWLIDVRLYPAEKAPQRLKFYDALRGYIINYNLGQDMVHDYIVRQTTETDPLLVRRQQWQLFKQLMATPRVPSALL